jgi:hypothetical protein
LGLCGLGGGGLDWCWRGAGSVTDARFGFGCLGSALERLRYDG